MKKKRTRVKVNKILIVLFFFAFFCATIKLSYVALSPVVDGTNLAEFVEGRNTTTETLYASRGNIYDINGEVGYQYGIYSLPTTIFIHKDGTIEIGYKGMLPENVLRQEIQKIKE